MLRNTAPLFTALLLAGCSFEIVTPGITTDGLPAGLEVDLVVDPAEVTPHAPFTVRFTATNTTDETMRIVTAHGCLVTPGVYRNGVRVPFRGSGWGCTAAVTTHVFAPGETKTFELEMRAELYAEHPGDTEGAPAPRGRYVVRMVFDTPPADDTGRQPGVEAALRVR